MKDDKKMTPELYPMSVPEKTRQDTVWGMINKFGTYEIQSTNDTENEYPAIMQGLPDNMKNVKEDQET